MNSCMFSVKTCSFVSCWPINSSLTFRPAASLRSELNHIHASAIEHLRQTHHQEAAAAKAELEKTLENNRTQVEPERGFSYYPSASVIVPIHAFIIA